MEPHIFQEKHIRGAAGGRLTRMETKGGSFHVFFVLLFIKSLPSHGITMPPKSMVTKYRAAGKNKNAEVMKKAQNARTQSEAAKKEKKRDQVEQVTNWTSSSRYGGSPHST